MLAANLKNSKILCMSKEINCNLYSHFKQPVFDPPSSPLHLCSTHPPGLCEGFISSLILLWASGGAKHLSLYLPNPLHLLISPCLPSIHPTVLKCLLAWELWAADYGHNNAANQTGQLGTGWSGLEALLTLAWLASVSELTGGRLVWVSRSWHGSPPCMSSSSWNQGVCPFMTITEGRKEMCQGTLRIGTLSFPPRSMW